jgi:hypothetical protein
VFYFCAVFFFFFFLRSFCFKELYCLSNLIVIVFCACRVHYFATKPGSPGNVCSALASRWVLCLAVNINIWLGWYSFILYRKGTWRRDGVCNGCA